MCESQLTLVVDVDQEFHVVDVVTRSVKCVIPSDSFTDDVDLLGISEDGKSLVFSGTDDGKLRCWNVIKGSRKHQSYFKMFMIYFVR